MLRLVPRLEFLGGVEGTGEAEPSEDANDRPGGIELTAAHAKAGGGGRLVVVVPGEEHAAMNLVALEIFARLAICQNLNLVAAQADVSPLSVVAELEMPAISRVLLADRAITGFTLDVVETS